MAFFKFRKGDDASSASVPPSQAESVEAMRTRARQRLIGAAVLVLAGVIGFPLVFDTQPRPIAVDIPIDIPDRAKPRAPGVPSAAAAGAVATPAPGLMKAEVAAEPAAAAPVAAAPAPAFAPVTATAPAPAAAASPAVRPASKPEARPAASTTATTAPASKPATEAERAKALLEGAVATASGEPAAGEARFVVQVGAFAEPAKAAAARQKLEKAGLKTYTHVAETKEGKRTRVRVGPFTSRGEAEKAAAKVKGLELPAAVLTL